MAVPILGKKDVPKEETFRLLHCFVCDSLEELPPYEGPPEMDHLLEAVAERHAFPSGERHKGQLYVVPVRVWTDTPTRKNVIEQIKGGGSKGIAEIDSDFYVSRSTFMEDAMTCYRKHNKPKDGCGDWHKDDKRIVPQTHKERKDAGMERPETAPGPKTYICDFCPVAVGVAQRKRKLLGLE